MKSQFQNAVGGISYQLDGHRGKPTTQQAHHLTCSHAHGLVPCSQLLAYFRGRRQDTQKGQGPPLLGPGQRDDYGHDDPASARTTYRPLAAGEGTIAVMSTL